MQEQHAVKQHEQEGFYSGTTVMKQRAGGSCVGESNVQEAAADVKAACRRQLQMSGSVREAAADMKAACKRQLRMKL